LEKENGLEYSSYELITTSSSLLAVAPCSCRLPLRNAHDLPGTSLIALLSDPRKLLPIVVYMNYLNY
jgi:hypothetical protein